MAQRDSQPRGLGDAPAQHRHPAALLLTYFGELAKTVQMGRKARQQELAGRLAHQIAHHRLKGGLRFGPAGALDVG